MQTIFFHFLSSMYLSRWFINWYLNLLLAKQLNENDWMVLIDDQGYVSACRVLLLSNNKSIGRFKRWNSGLESNRSDKNFPIVVPSEASITQLHTYWTWNLNSSFKFDITVQRWSFGKFLNHSQVGASKGVKDILRMKKYMQFDMKTRNEIRVHLWN